MATSTEAAPGNGIIASSFFRASELTLGSFAGDGFRRFGLESCWGSAVSQPRSTELLGAVSELCSREFFADEVATSTEAGLRQWHHCIIFL